MLMTENGWCAVRAGILMAKMDTREIYSMGDGVSNAEIGETVIKIIKDMTGKKLNSEFQLVMKSCVDIKKASWMR